MRYSSRIIRGFVDFDPSPGNSDCQEMRETLAAERGQPDCNSGCEQGVPVLERALITGCQMCYSAPFLNLPYGITFEGGNATFEPMSASPDMPGQIVREICSSWAERTH